MEEPILSRIRAAVFLAASLLAAGPAAGIVLHADSDAPAGTPNAAVVGRWCSNASAVAIGRSGWAVTNYIITTRHQGQNSTSVWFGGTEYQIVETWNHPTADLRVVRIQTLDGQEAYLPNFVQWYTGTDETDPTVSNCVIGGFGKGRGSELRTASNKLYGYTWSGANNQTQRWGSNNIEWSGTKSDGTYTSDVIKADFDGPASKDAAVALYDSGGGWFIQKNGVWYVAGLTRGVDPGHATGESWFADPVTGQPRPDVIDAVRVSSYASWIDGKLPEWSIPGDYNHDGYVDQTDYLTWANNYGQTVARPYDGADGSGNGIIDQTDYVVWANHYGDGTPPGGSSLAPGDVVGGMTVPEPAVVLMLVGGAPLLLRMKRASRRR